MTAKISNDPIFNVVIKDASDLKANGWNPNVVMNQELRLLEESILSYGWMQPVIINANDIIVDGFHRWFLASTSKKLAEVYGSQIPCVVLGVDDKEAMMMTVRMNRAKGVHSALRMRELVQSLIDEHKATPSELRTKWV